MQESEKGLLDKLNEKYMDIVLTEDVDARLKRLAREGLISDGDYALFLKRTIKIFE